MVKHPITDDEEFRTLFPYRLHQVLSWVEAEGLGHVMSWLPCGKRFKVHDVKEFSEKIMPKLGRFTRYKSFLRQLSMYKFQRISSGSQQGSYEHPYFRKDHIDLCRAILRGEIFNPRSKEVLSRAPTSFENSENIGCNSMPVQHCDPCTPQSAKGALTDNSMLRTRMFPHLSDSLYANNGPLAPPFHSTEEQRLLSMASNVSTNGMGYPFVSVAPSSNNLLTPPQGTPPRLSSHLSAILDQVCSTFECDDSAVDIDREIIATFGSSVMS